MQCSMAWALHRTEKKSQQPEKPTTGVISGGVGGIRTHGTVAGTPDFESFMQL